MKKFLLIVCIILGGLYYAFQDRDVTDIQKMIGNPAVSNVKTKKEIRAEEEKINKYDVGHCLKISSNSDLEVFKIVKVDFDKKDYHYTLCVKFKGCQKEVQKEIITNFEYDYPPSRRIPCF